MRRLLTSLPIALFILAVLIFPAAANAGSIILNEQSSFVGSQVISTHPTQNSLLAADNASDVPEGLTLTKGVPFITPSEANEGDLVTIKVKATNGSPTPIEYTLSLKINGIAAGSPQQLSLDSGGSKDVVFQVQAENNGNNDVTVGNLKGFFTVKEGSFFDIFPIYLWIFFAVIAGVIILLVVLMVLKPPKKRVGASMEQSKKQGKQKGKPGKAGAPESQIHGGVPAQHTGMPNMAEAPFGSQGQPGAFQDFTNMQQQQQQQFQPQTGMQPLFQPQQQQGGPQQFQPQQQGGAQQFQPQQQQFQPTQQPGMPQAQQFQPQPGMPYQAPQQPGMQTPPQGIQQPPSRGSQYPPSNQPFGGYQHPQPSAHGMPGGQPAMPPYGMPPAQQPGMQQPMPPANQQFMPPPMQPQMAGGAYQSMGMPKFSVNSLTITPNNVKVGEPVSISIIVCNNGIQTGKYSVVLRIGGVVENISDLTLPPGASQTASFTVVKDSPGDYYADIDGLGGFFTVIPLTPPSFIVTNFTVGPERVRQGQPVIVTASVTNTGEITGNHTLILRVKGLAESQKEITLSPGRLENVEFQIIKDTPGFYPVALENWTGKFVVEMDWTG